MKSLQSVLSALLLFLLLFPISLIGCGKGAKVATTIKENAARGIEFFSKEPTYPPKRLFHNKYRFRGKGNSLIIQWDEWQFENGRRNFLHHCLVPLDQIDSTATETTEPPYPVGPIGYKGGKTEIDPKQIVIRIRGGKPSIQCTTYDRGGGKFVNSRDESFQAPSKDGTTKSLIEFSIYAPNPERAQRIIDALIQP